MGNDLRKKKNVCAGRDQVMCELTAVTSAEFAQQCYKTLKADANVYGYDVELCHMKSARRLILRGVSEAHVLEALQNREEHLIEAMLR